MELTLTPLEKIILTIFKDLGTKDKPIEDIFRTSLSTKFRNIIT